MFIFRAYYFPCTIDYPSSFVMCFSQSTLLVNLAIEDAEEAFSLVPSLAEKFDEKTMQEMLDELKNLATN